MKILEKIKSLSEEKKVFIYASLIILSFLTIIEFNVQTPQSSENPSEIDTFIPKGFVLIPIQILNIKEIDSILGQFAIVNVYRKEKNRTKLIAQKVRLLRSPKNPNVFAVLTPEKNSSLFLSSDPDFFIALHNKSANGTEFEKKSYKRKWIMESLE